MQRDSLSSLAFFSLLIASTEIVSAAPVQWSGNGHFYQVVSVPGTISWEDASTAATNAGGYLATITSAAENSFVFGLVSSATYWHGYSGPWLGGYQSPATAVANANWRWVTGEAWSYTNWQTGQPNHSGGKLEDKLQFGFDAIVPVWNDIMSIDPTPAYRPIAYVIEWNTDPLVPTLEIRLVPAGESTQVELCWQTASGRWYQLLSAEIPDSNPNGWAPLRGNWITGDGTRQCEMDAVVSGGSDSRFYRLLCTNSPPN